MTGIGVGGRNLAAHSVGVAAPAAGARGAVVGTLAQGKAQPGRRVAAEAGQAERQEPHGTPAGPGMGRGAGTRPVSAVVLVVLGGAVVEEAFDAAQARAVFHEALGGAQTALSAGPARGQAAGGAALLALTAAAPLADEQMEAPLGFTLRQAFSQRIVGLEFSFGLRTDHGARVGWSQTCQESLVRGGTGPGHGRAYGTGTAQVGRVSLLLTLAAGQGGVERGLAVVGVCSMGVTVIKGVEESGLGRWFQGHWPIHVVIVGPDEPNLVNGQNRDLLGVQAIQLHPEGMSGVHPGEPGWLAPRLHAGVGAGCPQHSRHIR